MLREYTQEQLTTLLYKQYELTVDIKFLCGYTDRNYLLKDTLTNNKYILRISSSAQNQTCVKLQNYVLKQLQQKFTFQSMLKCRFPQLVPTSERDDMIVIEEQGKKNFIRVFRYVEGKDMWDFPNLPDDIFESVGQIVGEISLFLEDLTSHPYTQQLLKQFDLSLITFNITYFPQLYEENAKYLSANTMTLVTKCYKQFMEIQPILKQMPVQVVHNDMCSCNFLIGQQQGKCYVSGLIDFGDFITSIKLSELAVACARTNMDENNPLKNALTIIKSYNSIINLTKQQKIVLFPLIKSRLALLLLHSGKVVFESDNEYTQKCFDGFKRYLEVLTQACTNEQFHNKLENLLQ